MRIVLDISQIVYEGTGTATYTRNLVENLLRLNYANKHEYLLFGSSLRRKHLLDQFAKQLGRNGHKFTTAFYLLPPSFANQVWNQIHHVRLERLIGKFDLLHSSDWVQPPTRAKKVTTIHDLVVYKYPESSTNQTKFRFDIFAPIPNIVEIQKQRLSWVKKEVDIIIADSLATKKDIIGTLKIPENKIRVVYLAAGDDYLVFQNKPQAEKSKTISFVKKKYNLTKDYILSVGTNEPRKNLGNLVAAFQSLKLNNVDLAMSGKVGWGNRIDNDKNIKSLGFVPQEDLPALYAGAKFFAYPSLYEGFGVPVLESLTVGTPVLTSRVGSLPEVAGSAAIYVNPTKVSEIAKGLTKLLTLPNQERKKLIEQGQVQTKKFSWQKTAEQTLKAYEELM